MKIRDALQRAIAVPGLALVLAGSSGCRERAEPVASLRVEPKVVNLEHSRAVSMRLRWSPKAPLDGLRGHPRVFVHLLRGRELLRTFDHPLTEEWSPWRPQTYEVDLYQSAIAESLPAGAYELTLGLYDDSSGERWALEVEGAEVGRREYRLATVVVPAASAGAPTFEFAGGWLPVEPGGSRQVIARRCARGEAAITVRGVASPGTVRLGSSVPKGASGAVEVTASCTAERAEIRGPEFQWVSIPIGNAAAGPDCEIRLRPAAPTSVDPENERSVCLEVLAWRPVGE